MKWIEAAKKKYPLDRIEQEIEKIEKLGYKIVAEEHQCLIWQGNKLIIDADFHNDFHSNVADAIYTFWNFGA